MGTIEDMYQELLNQSSIYDPDLQDILGVGGIQGLEDDEDIESFSTSEDIAKKQKSVKKNFDTSPKNVEIEEDVHFKLYSKRRKHKYTEKEMQQIRESCTETIVHDYGEFDIYHMSDEDRLQNDMLAEVSVKLASLKSTYRKVNEYVEAMRVVVQAWQILEKHNYIHTEEEFYQMIADGRIVSNRIIMPKLKNMNSYNIDMIIRYVSNPELDPMDLVPANDAKRINLDTLRDEFYVTDEDSTDMVSQMFNYYYDLYLYNLSDDADFIPSREQEDEAREYAVDQMEKDEMAMLLSPEEAQFILDYADNPPAIEVTDIKPKYIKGYDRKINFSKRNISKRKRLFMENLHNILRKIEENPENQSETTYNRSYLITHNMFEPAKPEKSVWDDLYYDGSWTDDESLELYDFIVREELLKQTPLKEHYVTYADKELAKFFNVLESNGVSTIKLRQSMNMTENDIARNEENRNKKENKKTEAAILQRVIKMNGNPKFKKVISKAEEALNAYNDSSKGGKK